MNVSSVAGSSTVQAPQRTSEASEVNKSGPDHDGDADDGARAVQAASGPTTNASGKTIGQIINVTA